MYQEGQIIQGKDGQFSYQVQKGYLVPITQEEYDSDTHDMEDLRSAAARFSAPDPFSSTGVVIHRGGKPDYKIADGGSDEGAVLLGRAKTAHQQITASAGGDRSRSAVQPPQGQADLRDLFENPDP